MALIYYLLITLIYFIKHLFLTQREPVYIANVILN